MNILLTVLGWLSSGSIIAPFIISLITCKRLKTSEEQFFAIFIGITVIHELAMNTYAMLGLHNIFISETFSLLDGIILILIIGGWVKDKLLSSGRYYIAVFYGILWTIFAIKYGISNGNPFISLTERSLICVLAGYVLINIMVNIDEKPTQSFAFWACTGVFFFYVCTISIEALWFLLPFNSAKYYMLLHGIVNITGNLLFARAFWCRLKPTRAVLYI